MCNFFAGKQNNEKLNFDTQIIFENGVKNRVNTIKTLKIKFWNKKFCWSLPSGKRADFFKPNFEISNFENKKVRYKIKI